MEDQEGIIGSGLWPGPPLATAVIWGINQVIKDKEWSWTLTLYHAIQKLTQNDQMSKCKSKKCKTNKTEKNAYDTEFHMTSRVCH